jgi:hypothetical protein
VNAHRKPGTLLEYFLLQFFLLFFISMFFEIGVGVDPVKCYFVAILLALLNVALRQFRQRRNYLTGQAKLFHRVDKRLLWVYTQYKP